jgi:hypothetical protein
MIEFNKQQFENVDLPIKKSSLKDKIDDAFNDLKLEIADDFLELPKEVQDKIGDAEEAKERKLGTDEEILEKMEACVEAIRAWRMHKANGNN